MAASKLATFLVYVLLGAGSWATTTAVFGGPAWAGFAVAWLTFWLLVILGGLLTQQPKPPPSPRVSSTGSRG